MPRKSKKSRRNDGDKREELMNQGSVDDSRNVVGRGNSLNDIGWYSKYPALLTAVASIPFPNRPGMRIPIAQNVPSTGASYVAVPGIMSLYWSPSVGKCNQVTDPASVCARELYARVRASFSGRIYADAPDFLIYIMAMDSIYSAIGEMKRVFRIARTWGPDNYMVPEALLYALGWDPVDTMTNRTQLWDYINQLALMTQKFKVPADLDVFNRHYWMNDNIYLDTPSANGQMYAFVCGAYYQYDPTIETPDGVAAGGLKYSIPMYGDSGRRTPTSMYTFVKGLIESLSAWDDAYTISGYLQRAFEGSSSFTVDQVAIDERFEALYVPEVLSQIENFKPVYMTGDSAPSITSLDANIPNATISQNPTTNTIICNPNVSIPTNSDLVAYSTFALNIPLSVRADNPSVADVAIASRMLSYIDTPKVSGANTEYQIHCGTEIPWAIMITTYVDGGSGSMSLMVNVNVGSVANTVLAATSAIGTRALRVAAQRSQFDWRPIGYTAVHLNSSGKTTLYFEFDGDIHNVTIVSKEDIDNLNRVCTFSEFSAFNIG